MIWVRSTAHASSPTAPHTSALPNERPNGVEPCTGKHARKVTPWIAGWTPGVPKPGMPRTNQAPAGSGSESEWIQVIFKSPARSPRGTLSPSHAGTRRMLPPADQETASAHTFVLMRAFLCAASLSGGTPFPLA